MNMLSGGLFLTPTKFEYKYTYFPITSYSNPKYIGEPLKRNPPLTLVLSMADLLFIGFIYLYRVLPILFLHFEVSLRVLAGGAQLGSFLAYIDESAVAALPNHFTFPSCPFSATAMLRYIKAISGKPSSSAMSANLG